MKRSFKVNLEKYLEEDDLKLFLNFIERNKNKIKIIHNNKIKSLENEIITKKSKIKFILLNNPFNYYQTYQMKYNLREIKKKYEHEEDDYEEDEHEEDEHEEDKYEEDKHEKDKHEKDKYEEDKYEKDMDKDKNIKIFGQKFIKKNYSKCFILYKDIIFPLKEYFSIKYINIKKDNKLEIKLISFENISDFSYMFDGCKSLEDFAFFQNNKNK